MIFASLYSLDKNTYLNTLLYDEASLVLLVLDITTAVYKSFLPEPDPIPVPIDPCQPRDLHVTYRSAPLIFHWG